MIVLPLFLAVLGLAMGSFLTVVAERLDGAESFLIGRSKCNHCKKTLSWWELLPFFGYFLIKGQCTKCHKEVPRIYPFFELFAALAFVAIWWAAPQPLNYWLLAADIVTASLLVLLFIYDWLNQSFPAHVLYLTFGWVLLVAGLRVAFHQPITTIQLFDPTFQWLASPHQGLMIVLLGGLVGAGLLGLLAFPSGGRWMGYGDVILIAILGVWIGYPLVLVALVLAFYSGALWGGTLLMKRRLAQDHRIAFGPFLIFGALAALVWGQTLFLSIMKLWGIL